MRKIFPFVLLLLASCSTTSSLEDGEQLYTGLIKTEYNNYESSAHQETTQEEVEAALATAPNGALFGSSYYRTPFPYGLWIWNSCAHSSGVIKKWLTSTFGKPPVLMSNVNPALRSSVAKNILQNNGYFNGDVSYNVIEGKAITTKNDTVPQPRTVKIQYKVNFGHLYKLDSITYNNFPDHINTVLSKSPSNLLFAGAPFSVNNLDGERNRIYSLLRNNGYYYYQKQYTTFLADTINSPGNVLLKVKMLDSLPSITTHKWIIGKTAVQIKRQILETITDSIQRKFLTIRFAGKKPAIRPRLILASTKLRPGALFSEEQYEESIADLNSLGVFSSVDINFQPRLEKDGTVREVQDSIVQKYGAQRAGAGILDMTINAVLDKPYDLSFTATGKGKTDGRLGPGITFGLSKRNAFRGGELLSAEIGASYEFQTGGGSKTGSSYDFNTSLSLTFPRLLAPNFLLPARRRWYNTPSTVINISGETIRRSGFFNRNIISANITYMFQPTATSMHQFTPFSLIYGKTTDKTDDYLSKIEESVTSVVAIADEMTPFMRYKYIFTSPLNYKKTIYWETTLTEAGNVTSLLNMVMSGKKWHEKNKKLLSTPYSQFLKFETELRKTWNLHDKSSFIAHFYGGVICPYGNSASVPYSEQFFIGGANDMRGFAMYSLGPGSVHFDNKDMGYLYQNGDMKLVFNLEYRPHLFGSLYGAVYLDAGNVWYLNNSRQNDLTSLGDAYASSTGSQARPDWGSTKKADVGIDIGCGLRYDLDFFVLRIDWAFAIHTPYKTGSAGFFNIPKFGDAQCLNFAIGYPF